MLVGYFVMMLLNSRIRCGLDMSEITFVIYVCTPANVGLLVTHQLPLYTQEEVIDQARARSTILRYRVFPKMDDVAGCRQRSAPCTFRPTNIILRRLNDLPR